jgi:hypothetical protein
VFGRPHDNAFQVTNSFSRGAGGVATLVVPEGWDVEPREIKFRLAAGEQAKYRFQITLPYNAASGSHLIRVDFKVRADQVCEFSVYRHLNVGMGEVHVDVATRLNPQGELEVQQRFTNKGTSQVSFRCQLFAPGRRRLKSQVIGLVQGSNVQAYVLPDGRELLGKTLWIRAEEMNGPRVLNYRFVAEE